MSEFLRCLAGMFAAIAPLGALAAVMIAHRSSLPAHPEALEGRAEHRTHASGAAVAANRTALFAPAIALLCLAVAALLADPLLDWLNVSGENFQFAAGAAMVPLALRLILTGDSMALPERLPSFAWLVPLAVPLLAGPASIIAAISYAARFGEAEAIGASAAVLALTAALFAAAPRLQSVPPVAVQTLGRLSGGLVLVIAVELAVDGVRSV